MEEHGFTGGETTIRRLVRQLREKPQVAFVPLVFPAGDAIQIDWGEATVYLKGVKTVVNLFCARLCYSGAPMVLAYRRQNEESFLDALVQVFQYFGGVPRRVIFDNGKVASRMDSASMPGNRPAMPHWLPTTVLKRYSAILLPAMKRVLWKVWWVTVAAIPVFQSPR